MDYELKRYAEFVFDDPDEHPIAISIVCPNCLDIVFTSYFKNLFGGRDGSRKVAYQRWGTTLDDLTLKPAFEIRGHFHGSITDGKLRIDSKFACRKKPC